MKKMKRVLALMLSLLMIATALPLGAIVSFAQISTASLSADLAFYVPEEAYLYPNLSSAKNSTSTPVQYWIQNTVNTSNIYATPTTNTNKTSTGTIYFATPNATNVSISYRWLKANGMTAFSSQPSISLSTPASTNGYYTSTIPANVSSPELTSSETGCYIEWTATYTDSVTGKQLSAIAYTYVYKPYVVPSGTIVRPVNTDWNDGYLSSIVWLSGSHSAQAGSGGYYPNYYASSSGKGFAPFLSSDNVGYVGSTSTSGIQSKVAESSFTLKTNPTFMYAVYASTTASNAYFYADQTNSTYNNVGPTDWFTKNAANSYASIPTFDYQTKEDNKKYVYAHAATTATTNITIDLSRYNNLNQIPNLGIGLMVTDDENADKQAWYIGDATNLTQFSSETGSGKSVDSRIHEIWNSRNYVIASQFGHTDGGFGNVTSLGNLNGLQYTGSWYRELTTSATQVYTVRAGASGYDDYFQAGIHSLYLTATQYNKASLRSAVDNAISKFAEFGVTANYGSIYYNTSSYYWTTFVNAYKAASQALTKLDGTISNLDTLVSNLNSAVTNLMNGNGKLSATATANHYAVVRTLNETGATTGYKVNSTLANETKTYYYSDTLTIASNTYDNYSYQGYAKPTSSNGSGSTFSTANGMVSGTNTSISGRGITMHENGNDNFNFYYLASDVNLTIDPNGGSWNGSSGTSTVTGSYGSVFTPVNPARSGYTFDKWVLTTSGGGSLSGNTFTFGNSAATLTASWTITDSALNTDTTVIDFSLPVSVTPLANDAVNGQSGISFYGISLSGDSYSTANVTGTYGTFSVNGGTVTYTPSGIMQGADSVHYAVSYTDPASGTVSYAHSTFTVYPATVLYYEDDNAAISYSAGWTTVTDDTAPVVSEATADKVYGYSDAYAANSSQYSMNAAKVATVSKTNNKPTATFTFAGTGFDLVSLISKDTGTIEVKVYSGTSVTGTPAYDWIVDTYYTYKPETDPDTDTNWEPDNGNTAALYQIPVIGRTDLDYGTYTVVVIPTYSSRLDHEKDGAYDFYLDAIRIYNPCGYDNDEANAVYAADHEKLLTPNQSVYDLLAGSLSTDSEINGAVFINTNVTNETDITAYKSIGPKNEVYLKPGQAIAFNVTANDENAKVRISVHSADGNPASMRFGRESGSYTKNITVNSCTALYYDVPIEWNNGSGLVIIANTSANDSILSVCDVRITTNQTASVQSVSYAMPARTFALARTMAYTLSDLTEEDDGLFVAGDVTTEEITEAVVSGDSIEVTITTMDDVDRLTVNGQDATCTEEADGTKTWTFTYAADETGEQTLELVAYDAYGYASESTTMTVTVESKLEHFFHNLAKFIKAILKLIRTIAKAVEF